MPGGKHAPLIVLALVACATFHEEAHACSQYARPFVIVEPVFESELVVIEESVFEIDCSAENPMGTVCSSVARYSLRNTASESVTSKGAIFGPHREEPRLSLASLPLENHRGVGPSELLRKVPDDEDRAFIRSVAQRFTITLGAGDKRELAVHDRSALGAYYRVFGPGCEPEPILMRHPKAGVGVTAHTYPLRIFVAPGIHSSTSSTHRLRLRRPKGWRVSAGFREGPDLAITTKDEGDVTVDEATFPTSTSALEVAMKVPQSTFFQGGPFVGAGWWFAPSGGVRVRMGYEFAAPYFLLHSVAFESDFSRNMAAVPGVGWLTNNWHTVYGLGLGLPLKLQPDRRVGVRLEAQGSFDFLTVRGALDFFPATAVLARTFEGSLVLQVTL